MIKIEKCEKLILRHYSIASCPIYKKFGKMMQNYMPLTRERPKSKLELECSVAVISFLLNYRSIGLYLRLQRSFRNFVYK